MKTVLERLNKKHKQNISVFFHFLIYFIIFINYKTRFKIKYYLGLKFPVFCMNLPPLLPLIPRLRPLPLNGILDGSDVRTFSKVSGISLFIFGEIIVRSFWNLFRLSFASSQSSSSIPCPLPYMFFCTFFCNFSRRSPLPILETLTLLDSEFLLDWGNASCSFAYSAFSSCS